MKTVLLPIQVPDGEYCFHHDQSGMCDMFQSGVGCHAGFNPTAVRPMRSVIGYKKPPECRALKEV